MKYASMLVLFAGGIGLAHGAETWTVKPTSVDGMTPTEQLTNAVTKAASGDTISFEAGTYQLDGKSYMETYTTAGSGATLTTKNYITLAKGVAEGKTLTFTGPASGHWNDAVVIRGTGVDRFIESCKGTKFKNLTFENFASNDHPEKGTSDNSNTDRAVNGGAIRCNASDATTLVTNCVFRGNVSRTAGAINNGYVVDCFFTNNTALSYLGGATLYGSFRSCTFVDNRGKDGAGALWWPSAMYDCTCIGNVASNTQGGAIIADQNAIISNCLFRKNCVLNGGGGGAATLRINARFMDCRFEDNWTSGTSKGGGAVYGGSGGYGSGTRFDRCTFSRNASSTTGGAVHDDTGLTETALVLTDCVFSNNTSVTHGGALFGAAASNCTFFANASYMPFGGKDRGNGGAVYMLDRPDCWLYGCTFTSNRVGRTGFMADDGSGIVGNWGSALYSRSSNLVRRCVFYGNFVTNNTAAAIIATPDAETLLRLVDCAFTNNYALSGSIVRNVDCTNVTFFGNEVIRDGGVLYEGRAVDCRFVGNRKADTFYGLSTTASGGDGVIEANSPAGDAYKSTLVRCTCDQGCIRDCVLVDSTITSLTNASCYCAFYGHNIATNCLIANCYLGGPTRGGMSSRGLFYRWGNYTSRFAAGEYVNCTFADNKYAYFLKHAQEASIPTVFRNCLFYNNKSAYGTLIDIKYSIKTSIGTDSGISLTNCVYGALSTDNSPASTWTDLGGNRLLAPDKVKIVGDKASKLQAPYYALCYGSPVRGTGDATLFAADATDFAGQPRLRDGRVDPGCYESWADPVGMMLLFR